MIIGGLQKFSLLDFPENLSAVVFTKGCNFRCQFCYNPMLVWPSEVGKFNNKSSSESDEEIKKGHAPIKEDDLFDFLKGRINKLDAVVITGGEPTIHADLPEFILRIKNLGFKIKLDTNGTNPAMLKELASRKLIDYIAMDIKAPLLKYQQAVGIKTDLNKIKKSVKIIMESGLPYEFRSTLVPGIHAIEDIEKIGSMLKNAEKWYLQRFNSDTQLINMNLKDRKPFSSKEMEKMKKIAGKYVKKCDIR
jgi:pyruvate formate lyase activating enzyme